MTLASHIRRDADFSMIPSPKTAAGKTVLLECGSPRGHPKPTLHWKKNAHKIDLDATKRITLVNDGNLMILDVRRTDQKKIGNMVGVKESTVVTLTVDVNPFFLSTPANRKILTDQTTEFGNRVVGDPDPKYFSDETMENYISDEFNTIIEYYKDKKWIRNITANG